MLFDRRHGKREPIALTIMLASGVTGLTRDLGPQGLYFHMPLDEHLDDWVRLELDLSRAGLRASALGEVLRIERGERDLGVAMRLHALQLRPLD